MSEYATDSTKVPVTPAEARRLWVERLRSADIRQAKYVLGRIDGSRCCLGVACDIAVEHGIIPAPHAVEGDALIYGTETYQSKGVLPCSVRDWLGLRKCNGSYCDFEPADCLSGQNDAGKSFAQIADLIEDGVGDLLVCGKRGVN